MPFPTADFVIRIGDTGPRINATLQDGNGNTVDVTGATVALRLHGLTVVAALAMVGTVTDGPTGQVHYDWQSGDVVVPGFYAAEFRVTLVSGQVQTFPNDGIILLEMTSQS